MARRFFGLAAAAVVVLFAAACDESPPSAPQDSPSFAKTPPSDFACIFTGNPSLSNSAGSYFQTNVDRKAAADTITVMQNRLAANDSAGARNAGYSLLALTGKASRDRSRAGSIEIGETMVKQAINCMYDTKNPPNPTDFTNWPNDVQYDFSAALDAPNGGAFFVRGGADDDHTLPVVGNLASPGTDPVAGGNVSGIAPPTGSTWDDILASNSQKRTLIYGEPVSGGFDWKLIGRNTGFSPFAVVALCQAVLPVGEEFKAEDVVFQEDVGSLGVTPNSICGTLPSTFALGGYGRGGFGLVNRFVAMASRILSPEPLHATALATTIGGSASGAKRDEFTVLNLPTVNLKFTQQPPPRPKVAQRFPITVEVTTPAGDPAGGIIVTLSTTTNNGTGTAIFQITSAAPSTYTGCNPNDNPASGPAWLVTPKDTTLNTVGQNGENTEAHWDKVCFSKTGNVQIVATAQAAGNTFAGNGTKLSSRSNVDP